MPSGACSKSRPATCSLRRPSAGSPAVRSGACRIYSSWITKIRDRSHQLLYGLQLVIDQFQAGRPEAWVAGVDPDELAQFLRRA